MNVYDVGIMALRGVATSIFDIFFLFAIIAGYLVVVRFGFVNIYLNQHMKKPKDMLIEFIVQGIVMGVVVTMAVTFIGVPIVYSKYLLFLLPISFVLGYHHVRFTNLIYSALLLCVLKLFLNGQVIGAYELPNIDFNIAGMLCLVGLITLSEGLLLFLLQDKRMMPVIAKKDNQIIVGYAMQRFWPIPIALLVGEVGTANGADVIPMPEWWPIFGQGIIESMGLILFLIPMVFIVTHGSISFTKSPKEQLKSQGVELLVSGIVLLAGGMLIDRFQTIEFLGIILMFAVAYGPNWWWQWQEDKNPPIYPKTKRGVRVLHVVEEGTGETVGFKVGDLIKEVNGIEVTDVHQLLAIYKDYHRKFTVNVERENYQGSIIEFTKDQLMGKGLEIIYLPDEPEKIYDYDQVKDMGMMHMVKFHSMR